MDNLDNAPSHLFCTSLVYPLSCWNTTCREAKHMGRTGKGGSNTDNSSRRHKDNYYQQNGLFQEEPPHFLTKFKLCVGPEAGIETQKLLEPIAEEFWSCQP